MPRPHGFALAHAGARFAARLLDILAVLVLVAVANVWIAREFVTEFMALVRATQEAQRTGAATPEGSPQLYFLLFMMCVIAVLVWFAYEVPSTANSGQTLGKKIVGIKVVRLDTVGPLGFGRSLRRWSRLGIPTLLWLYWGVGLLLQAIDCIFVLTDKPLRQALHDRGANTVVVEVPRPGQHQKPPLENATPGGQDAHSR